MKIKVTVLSIFLFSSFAGAEDAVKAPAASPSPVAKKKIRTHKTPKTTKKAASTTTLDVQEKKPAKKSSVQVWLNRMKKKITNAESKRNKLVSVASVRGDEMSDTPPLYWKGKKSENPVALPELKEFDDAINLALNGDNAGAKTKLESFVSAYPNSPLKEDAQETLNRINEPTPAP